MSRWTRRGRPRITLSLLAAALVGVAGNVLQARAAEPVHTTTIGALTLPHYIGPLEYMGERSGADPRREASYSYRAAGLALDIEVHDLGAGAIPDGIDSPALTQDYEAAKRDLDRPARAGRARLIRQGRVRLGDRSAREAMFRISDGEHRGTTYLWLTAIHGLLLDVRFEVRRGFEQDGSISRGEVLGMLGAAIPAAPETVARARRAAQAAPDVNVAIVWDPATPPQESKIWLTYLFARAAYAASEHGAGPALGEREASFEEELRGRTIAVAAFREMRGQEAGLASTYFSDVERVEAAGFLREYVWQYLRRDSWTAVPGGLDLRAFEAWRAVHLRDHVAVTHGRIAFRLASQ